MDLVSFIPCINGLGFAYIGAKEFNNSWIKEGLIYEAPWLMFLVLDHDSATMFAGLGLLMQVVSILRSFIVYSQNKDVLIDDDDESRVDVEKSVNSLWIILSFIPYLSGLGIIYMGYKRKVQNWFFIGMFFEFLWALEFLVSGLDGNTTFFISLGMIGLILGIVLSFKIYFEDEKMVTDSYSTLNTITEIPKPIESPKIEESIVDNAGAEIIPEFQSYNTQINDLKKEFDQKEDNLIGLINKRFNPEELTYDRFISVIKNCRKLFDHQANSALSIIHLAPEYSERLDESVKDKISTLERIIKEMNNLIEEFIIHDGSDEQSKEDLNELFSNMDSLINSVKDYK